MWFNRLIGAGQGNVAEVKPTGIRLFVIIV
jgi:hypothetical protein